MKIVKPSASVLPAPKTPDELLQHIERCGRVCYKSEDKITEGSAATFIRGIIKRGHEAVLEHGEFCFNMSKGMWEWIKCHADTMELYGRKCYLRFTAPGYNACCHWLVSGNMRAWRDYLKFTHKRLNYLPGCFSLIVKRYEPLFPELQDVEFLKETVSFREDLILVTDFRALTKTERLVHQPVTTLFVCDRGVSHEIVRHRPASYCQESTRYCNYSKDGFGSEITVVEPPFFEGGNYLQWKYAMMDAEKRYMTLLEKNATPQEARDVLPNSLKTEVVMTATVSEWLHFFNLRTAAAAHPQMREVALLLKGQMYEIVADLMEDYENGKQ